MGDTISSLLFQPPPPSKLKEDKILWLDTKLGSRIPAFYIQAPQPASPNSPNTGPTSRTTRELCGDCDNALAMVSGVTILYSHANAEDLGNIYPWCKFLSKMLNVNVMAYDYTGYGLAHDQGEPSEENCYADIDAAYSYLRNSLRISPSNIVLYGRSLGSGPSCYLASRTADPESRDESEGNTFQGAVGGVILHAPFLSVFRIVLDSGCTLPGDKFPNVDYLPSVQSPVLMVHGTKDSIVPFDHSERLLHALGPEYRANPLFIEGMGHNNVHAVVRPMFVERVARFINEKVRPHATADARQVPKPSLRLVKRWSKRRRQSERQGGLDDRMSLNLDWSKEEHQEERLPMTSSDLGSHKAPSEITTNSMTWELQRVEDVTWSASRKLRPERQ